MPFAFEDTPLGSQMADNSADFMGGKSRIDRDREVVQPELFDEDHPVSFSRKLRLLKRWFRHEALAEYKPAIDKLSAQMKILSARRNEYLHALFSAYDVETDEITLRSIHYAGNDEFHIQRKTLNTKKLVSFAAAATNTNGALAVVSSALFTRDAVERLQTP
jgi:hypothetical protein